MAPESHFPIQNLPYGRFSEGDGPIRLGVAIGESVVDLAVLGEAGLLPTVPGETPELTLLEDRALHIEIRGRLQELLEASCPTLRDDGALRNRAILPMRRVRLHRPVGTIGAFVDFYSGIHHASNVGKMFRPEQAPLLPNYRHIPIGYNGRASSVVVSGTSIRRPKGQTKAPQAEGPSFGPTREMDFELEMGFFVRGGNPLGEPIPMERVEEHLFGLTLVNDWSARDLQRWEYQPLGPFLAKSFATSVSPWIVPLEALEPFRVAGMSQAPEPLPYLRQTGPQHYAIELEVTLQTQKMRNPQVISRTNARELYWSFAQQLAHQASNGTNLQTGDLYASGTISGAEPGTFGSMLELTWKGETPLEMVETGETRRFLEDGDVLTISGWCQGDGFRIGFGEVVGQILPSPG